MQEVDKEELTPTDLIKHMTEEEAYQFTKVMMEFRDLKVMQVSSFDDLRNILRMLFAHVLETNNWPQLSITVKLEVKIHKPSTTIDEQ